MAKSGTPAQRFKETHVEFLNLWREGLHSLEIANRLGLSASQVAKHSLLAFEENAPRKEPQYLCLRWDDLPDAIQKLLKESEQVPSLVKIEKSEKGVLVIPIYL